MRIYIVTGFALAGSIFGQSYQRQATIGTGGSMQQGQCAVEVQVDASAEVEIRGTAGVLRNLAGNDPQWRRFDCNGPMPINPTNFKYTAVGGRGQQQMTRNPSDSGVLIVRIDDKSGGAGTYTFAMEWQGYTGNADRVESGSATNPSIFDFPDDNTPNNGGRRRGNGNSISGAEAVETCQQEIMRQATQRFNSNNIYFRRTTIDNNTKAAQNQIRGTLDVNANNQSQRYRFNCVVNLNNGRVRSAQIDNAPANQNTRDYGYNSGNQTNMNRVIQACESAVDQRLSQQGLQRLGVASADMDDSGSRVYGSATVNDRNRRQQTVDFSCSVNLQNGTISSTDVIPRR